MTNKRSQWLDDWLARKAFCVVITKHFVSVWCMCVIVSINSQVTNVCVIGGSSGSAMYVALQVAKTMKKGEKLVVVLPDGIRNYMSKFVQDEWMREKGYAENNQQTSDES